MTITNGYCTLAELKSALGIGITYTAVTISFASATKKIADSAKFLGIFRTGRRITVSGSTKNDGTYTIATGSVAAEIVTTEALTTEAAGASVTISDVSDVADDAALESCVEAASRAIDDHTGTRFFVTTEDESRYYTPQEGDYLHVPFGIVSLTTLKTDTSAYRTWDVTWAATDYDLQPFNASLDSKPYTYITVAPQGRYSFPTFDKAVKLTGKFGYSSSTPAKVKTACKLLAEQLFKRRDALFGVVSNAFGEMRVLARTLIDGDPHLQLLLSSYVTEDIL